MKLHELTLSQLHQKLKSKEVSAEEAVQAQWAHIRAVEPKIEAFLTFCENQSLDRSRAIDSEIAKGRIVEALTGVPFAPRDIFSPKGSKHAPPRSCITTFLPTMERPCKALTKAPFSSENSAWMNCHGPSTELSLQRPKPLGPPAPRRLERRQRCAVSAPSRFGSLGRMQGLHPPAGGLSSIVGLKPTYGRVSRYGVVAFASRSIRWAHGQRCDRLRLILQAVAGHDTRIPPPFRLPFRIMRPPHRK
jgi:aspartyl-tRNA(Asn)/glutamyl-tRNA(Gln) amidotransferase subunit A